MVSKYILMAIIFSGLVTWIPRMIPFILAKYKGLPAIVERFFEIPTSLYYLCLDSFKCGDRKNRKLPTDKVVRLSSSLSDSLCRLSLPQSGGDGYLWSSLDSSPAFAILISHKENLWQI